MFPINLKKMHVEGCDMRRTALLRQQHPRCISSIACRNTLSHSAAAVRTGPFRLCFYFLGFSVTETHCIRYHGGRGVVASTSLRSESVRSEGDRLLCHLEHSGVSGIGVSAVRGLRASAS